MQANRVESVREHGVGAWSWYMYVYLHARCRRYNGTADHSSFDRCTRMYMYMSLANLKVVLWVLVSGIERVEFMKG